MKFFGCVLLCLSSYTKELDTLYEHQGKPKQPCCLKREILQVQGSAFPLSIPAVQIRGNWPYLTLEFKTR